MIDTLPVSEIFETIQGEGPAAGQAATFVRLMGCNLSCSWCDSTWTWIGDKYAIRSETTQMSPSSIIARVMGHNTSIVVFTGGEPLLQQGRPTFVGLLDGLAGRRIHVETNGTIVPSGQLLSTAEVICVSPKLGNAGVHRGHQNPMLHSEFAGLPARFRCLHLKVVCQDRGDVRLAVEMAEKLAWPRGRVWVMPEGSTRSTIEERWPTIASAAVEYGINATHRLHILAWDDEGGR